MSQTPSIDRLLNQAADAPTPVVAQLRAHPHLASSQDAHGYSLLHAAASWGHIDLLKALVQEFGVDVNLKDEDGETCLFNAETVDMAKEIVALGVAVDARNGDGHTAAEKLADEDEQPHVAAYLRQAGLSGSAEDAASASSTAPSGTIANGHGSTLGRPPPLPNGLEINVGTMHPDDAGGEPDSEFRRRIEELAARQDFEGDEAQRELRSLISDAVAGVRPEDGQGPTSRRRVG